MSKKIIIIALKLSTCTLTQIKPSSPGCTRENEALRSTLGTVQSIYTLLEASPKRHARFGEVRADSEPKLTLKSQSETRRSCPYESVNVIIQQLEIITKALLELKDLKDSKTSSNAKSLLIATCDFEFVLCIVILKIILSNVNALCRYLQRSTMDAVSVWNGQSSSRLPKRPKIPYYLADGGNQE